MRAEFSLIRALIYDEIQRVLWEVMKSSFLGGGEGGAERGWLMASEKLMTVYLLQRIHY